MELLFMNKKIITKLEKGLNRHWKNYLDKDYLGSHHLEDGEEMILTIAKFDGEENVQTAEGKKVKQVLYFKEDVPKMIMNITNGNTISALYGTHPENWIGKKIQVHSTKVKAFGEMKSALRVRDSIPTLPISDYEEKLKKAKNLQELKEIWESLPVQSNEQLIKLKDKMKAQYEDTK